MEESRPRKEGQHMISIDDKKRLSFEVCRRVHKGTYHAHFQPLRERENGSLEPATPGFFLPYDSIEPLIVKLKEAYEALTLVERCAFIGRTARNCTEKGCAADRSTGRCWIPLDGDPRRFGAIRVIVIDDETRLSAEVLGPGHIDEFFAYFILERRSMDGHWWHTEEGFHIPASDIDNLIAKLNWAQGEIVYRKEIAIEHYFDPIYPWETGEKLLAQTQEKIRALLQGGPKSERKLKESTQWEGEELELYLFEPFYSRAIENLTNSKKIRWNKEVGKWELVPLEMVKEKPKTPELFEVEYTER
jgi:hypothetical protein